MMLREGVRVPEECVRRLENPALGSCLEAAVSRWVEGARARCREKERVRTGDALRHVWKGMDIVASEAHPRVRGHRRTKTYGRSSQSLPRVRTAECRASHLLLRRRRLRDRRPGERPLDGAGRNYRSRRHLLKGGVMWAALSAHLVRILTAGPYCPGWCAMPALVVVLSTMHGAALKGHDATQGESRDAALALRGPWAASSVGLPVGSARFRDKRTMGPVTLMFDQEQEHGTLPVTARTLTRRHAAGEGPQHAESAGRFQQSIWSATRWTQPGSICKRCRLLADRRSLPMDTYTALLSTRYMKV
ncbi:hypothetical protein CGC20_23590 [Leishmania donovani]|uniref:Uncharacterized protein n=1 Tax=Leishmania donovani TaxID=5661 RepID=A0A504X9C6_LEIDO|nr:hypothetical protein CGC20_23590 [Leishmania donovani]